MGKLTVKELEIVGKLIQRKRSFLVDFYKKEGSKIHNPFSRFTTFFATSDPGYPKK